MENIDISETSEAEQGLSDSVQPNDDDRTVEKSSSKKRSILIILGLFLLVAVGYLGYSAYAKKWPICRCDPGYIDKNDTCVVKPLTTDEVMEKQRQQKAIDPLATDEGFIMSAVHTVVVQDEEAGIKLRVAHNQVIVSLAKSAVDSTEEQAQLHADILSLGAKVIGQTVGSVTRTWQLAVDNPADIQDVRRALDAHSAVRDARLNQIVVPFSSNKQKRCLFRKEAAPAWRDF